MWYIFYFFSHRRQWGRMPKEAEVQWGHRWFSMSSAAKDEPPPFTSTRFPDSSSPSRSSSLTSSIGAHSCNATRQYACPTRRESNALLKTSNYRKNITRNAAINLLKQANGKCILQTIMYKVWHNKRNGGIKSAYLLKTCLMYCDKKNKPICVHHKTQ